MAYFPTKNKSWWILYWQMLVYLIAIWSVYGYSVYFIAIRYMLWSFGIDFPIFGMLQRGKFGNPVAHFIFISFL
jgi:hypothetical protein